MNDIITEWKYHDATGEMLEKTIILWESLGRPNFEDENCKKKITLYAKLYRHKVGRWQNFSFANEIKVL